MNPRNATVFVVDDSRGREALSSLLASLGFQVVTFSSAAEFLQAERPDILSGLVLDLKLPRASGLELQQRLAQESSPPIIFISGHGDIPTSVRAIKAGAVEFLPKPFSEEELLNPIDSALALDGKACDRRAKLDNLQKRYALLTPREREVLPCVVAGPLNKQTAFQLGTSEIIIRAHRGQIMRKMQAHSLADLVRVADELGIRGN